MTTIPTNRLIDCDAEPFVPDGYSVVRHREGGQREFDPEQIMLQMYDSQHLGGISGHDLRKKLEGQPVLNACVLDYLLANPDLIPKEWMRDENGNHRLIYFWGTIYHDSVDSCLTVRWLAGSESGWVKGEKGVHSRFDSMHHAAVSIEGGLVTTRASTNRLIDCDAEPFVPEGLTVVEHRKGGMLEFDPSKIMMYLDDAQRGDSFSGHDLRKKLEGRPVLNACVLDHLLANPDLIPESWKLNEQRRLRRVWFLGTVYRDANGSLYVRSLYWSYDSMEWHDILLSLNSEYESRTCAAVFKS